MTSSDNTEPQPGTPAPPGPANAVPGGGLLPERSLEDTDAAWGDLPERNDDRLYQDRPPHWDDY